MSQIYYLDNRPNSSSAEDLFIFCVRMAINKKLFSRSLMHNQWANIIFGYENNSLIRNDNMSIVKREYSTYFTHERQYSFVEDKIRRDFPYLFGATEDDDSEYECEDIVRDTIKAVSKEIEENKDPHNIESFKGNDLTLVRKQGNSYVYQVMLSISDGQEPHFHDEVPFTLRVYSDDFRCEVVDYDYESGRLIFTTNRNLNSASYCKILLDSTFILEGLEQRLVELSEEGVNENYPFSKFLFNDTDDLAKIRHKSVPEVFKQKLDDSQRKAFNAALDNDITFIWGPPGTGKSFTLASIIYALYELGEDRTAVCCLSNVAVDQLLCKVLDLINFNKKRIEPGNIYRAGRTLDKRVLSTDYLFPKDQITQKLRNRIKQNQDRIQWLKDRKKEKSEESILLKAENKDYRDELKKHTEFLVKSSRLVFSTISNFVLNNNLYHSRFDNLIVDEASMIAMPSLLALGHSTSKRLILVGDFQQLSPIALIKDPALTESVFEMNDINIMNTNHPALHQLLHQRRSDERIVELINKTFYNGKLIPAAKGNEDIVNKEPFAGKVISLCNCVGAVRFSKGGTRQNKCFAECVIKLLDIFHQDKTAKYTIGVITPYRGQVSLIRALKFERQYNDEFEERIKIGTIHTFQGSECDVIIFDMVDCPKSERGNSLQIGKLYAAEKGERLLNVAVSRAKYKLIVVCDIEYIKNIPGNTITDNTRALFHKLSKYKAYNLQDYDNHFISQDSIDKDTNDTNDINDESEWFFIDSVPFSKASKDLSFTSCDCRVVLSSLGYYLEVNGEYIKLGDYPNGYSYDEGNIWIKKAIDNKGRRMVHNTEDGTYLIGFIREDDNIIVYTNPDGEEFTITFNS